jgi:outer membrane protein OmpA-like peptidoglycan-associated protein
VRHKLLRGIGMVVGALWVGVAAAQAGEPVIGVETGAAFPVTFHRAADTGGMIGLFGGYRFNLSERFGLSLLAEPQFAGFPSRCEDAEGQSVPCKSSDDMTGIFGFTAGPRFSLSDKPLEFDFGVQGGVYTYTNGPASDTDGGFNLGGGLRYEFAPGTSAGLLISYQHTLLTPAIGSSDHSTYVITGLGLQHRFLAPPPAVAAAPPPPPPPAPAPPERKKIVLRGVNFDFDKSVIRADARPLLDEAIRTLKEYGDVRVAVDGYTDSVGSDAYNLKLSTRRAQAVADYLAAGGIAQGRMTVTGFGESNPVASNETPEGRSENRRVELRVVTEPQ